MNEAIEQHENIEPIEETELDKWRKLNDKLDQIIQALEKKGIIRRDEKVA